VLSILRQALGLQQTPPNQVLDYATAIHDSLHNPGQGKRFFRMSR
jgi:flagellar biosynthesis protein FliP